MLSVSNVTMRYGAKMLFEDVSETLRRGGAMDLTGPNGVGQIHFYEGADGRTGRAKGNGGASGRFGVLRQDQFAFDAYRVIDTVIMGNKPLWAALEERDRIYEKAETDR